MPRGTCDTADFLHALNRTCVNPVPEAPPDEDNDEAPEYINEDCPGRCDEAHAPPSTDEYGTWQCSGGGMRYHYCIECGWGVPGRWEAYPTLIDGDWYCDPYQHDWTCCAGCGDWQHIDDTYGDDWGDGTWCVNCYSDREDDNVSTTSSARGEPIYTCDTCRTQSLYFDEVTEKFVCKCVADRLRTRRSPVKIPA